MNSAAPNFTMVIPTYWGHAEGTGGREKTAFDNPTGLHTNGTLPRLLETLRIFAELPGRIVVISVANDPEIAPLVSDKVDRLIAAYRRRFDIVNLSQTTLDTIRRQLGHLGVSDQACGLLNLDNYAAVRNICGLAGVLNASPYTIFIDDDEVFTDPDFLRKIQSNMGRHIDGQAIEALAGYYLQPETYRLDESKVPAWRAPYWNNAAAMNAAFDQVIGQGPRLQPTPFVFGGNMTVCLRVLKQVPFDPRITRGEDIDFLLNLRIYGITFYLDRTLAIKHLPPSSPQPAWKKLREDALRFLYERKKLNDHPQLNLNELQPYPGMFLGDDLEERIIKTCQILKRQCEEHGDQEGISECEKNIALVKENPFAHFDTRSWLSHITAQWQEITAAAEGMGIPDKSSEAGK